MPALILVVSSDPTRLGRLRKLVELQGATALTACDAPEAMGLFIRREPDVTLLHVDDEQELDFPLCADMKALRPHRSVLVVAARELRAMAFAAGCDAFVPRQNDAGPLGQAVRRFLNGVRRAAPSGPVEMVL